MKTRTTISILCLFLFFSIPLPCGAVPLSLEKNIKAILANQSGLNEGFDFIVLGDSRDNEKIYKRLLNQARNFKPRFLLNTGDIVNGGHAPEFETYRKWIADFDIPILHIPGNHDIHYGRTHYRKFVGDYNWSFDYGNCRIIGLDNGDGFSDEAVEFAQKRLTQEKVCLVAFHKPPAVGRWRVHAMMSDSKGGRGGDVMKLIKAAAGSMVFHGHIHLYDTMAIDGIPYVISGGGGAPLHDNFGFGTIDYGFVLVQVRSTGIFQRWVPLQ